MHNLINTGKFLTSLWLWVRKYLNSNNITRSFTVEICESIMPIKSNACMYVCVYVHVCARVCVSLLVNVSICVCVCVCVCAYMCSRACVHLFIHSLVRSWGLLIKQTFLVNLFLSRLIIYMIFWNINSNLIECRNKSSERELGSLRRFLLALSRPWRVTLYQNPSQIGAFGVSIPKRCLRHLNIPFHFLNQDYAFESSNNNFDNNCIHILHLILRKHTTLCFLFLHGSIRIMLQCDDFVYCFYTFFIVNKSNNFKK